MPELQVDWHDTHLNCRLQNQVAVAAAAADKTHEDQDQEIKVANLVRQLFSWLPPIVFCCVWTFEWLTNLRARNHSSHCLRFRL